MSVKFYRIALVIMTLWVLLCIPTILVPLSQGFKIYNIMVAIGFGMVLISAVGLWNKKTWGLIILILATTLSFIASRRIDMIMVHLILLGLSAIHYFMPKSNKSRGTV